MGIITRRLQQVAIYWERSGEPNDFDAFGNPSYEGPVAIDCRWEDGTEEIIGPDGSPVMSRATVGVDREVTVGGLLLLAPGFGGDSGGPLGPLGTITAIATQGVFISRVATPTDPDMADYTAADPKDAYGAWEIRKFSSTPDLRADEFLREAVL